MFVHVVLFWLKPGAPGSQRDALIRDARQLLGKIPDVRQIFVGEAALTPRDVVDNTYDVGLCVVLDDKAAHDAYQVHPLHKEFSTRHKDNWQRITIYDFR